MIFERFFIYARLCLYGRVGLYWKGLRSAEVSCRVANPQLPGLLSFTVSNPTISVECTFLVAMEHVGEDKML